jgi:hypothetical protein
VSFIWNFVKLELKYLIALIKIRLMLFGDLRTFGNTIWFLHGSTVDVFATCSLLSTHPKYINNVILSSFTHQPIISRYKLHDLYKIHLIDPARTKQYRKYYSWLNLGRLDSVLERQFKITHCVTDKTLYKLIKQNRLAYREALTFHLNLPSDCHYAEPSYVDSDYQFVEDIFSIRSDKLKSVALINSVAYTHGNFDSQIWYGVCKGLEKLGYVCFWNIAKKNDDDSEGQILNIKNRISIPTDLVPLASSMVGLCIGGMGGGFDLMHHFNKNSTSVLLHCNSHSKGGLKDYPLECLNDLYFKDTGREPRLIISISGLESENEIEKITYNKVKMLLNP